MENSIQEQLIYAMETLDEDLVIELTEKLMQEKRDLYQIIHLLDKGASRVGKLFEKGEYFIADLIVSSVIYANVLERFPVIESQDRHDSPGTVVIGVVRSDIHDVGKNIIASMLRAEGFRVIDLGVDVSADQFVAAALRYRPAVVALSGVLAYSAVEMGETIRVLENAGVREFSSILIGGVCTDENVRMNTGADAFAVDPVDTLKYCEKIAKDGDV